MCEAEDSMLGKLPCYKGVNLVPLRASALRALASCHYMQEKHCREKIFQVLYKSLEKNDTELQQVSEVIIYCLNSKQDPNFFLNFFLFVSISQTGYDKM